MKTTIIAMLAALLISLTASLTYASNPVDGNGDVTGLNGKVVDKNTGESLAGATIMIKGTDIKAYTDLDGNFSIPNLQPGTYTLEVALISYRGKELSNISATLGKTNTVDIAIQPE